MRTSVKITSFFFLCIGFNAMAQNPNPMGEEEINVLKPYKPVLSDAIKISSLPGSDTSKPLPIQLKYEIAPKKLTTKVEVEPIKPLKLKDETVPQLFKNFVKLGLGNYTTPYGELFINSARAKDYMVGFHYNHLSSSGKIPGVGYSGYSKNLVELYGKKMIDQVVLSGNMYFDRRVNHYYGYNSNDTQPSADAIRQRYNILGGWVQMEGNTKDSTKLQHVINLHYYNASDLYGQNEDRIKLSTQAGTKVPFAYAQVNLNLDYGNVKQPLQNDLDRTELTLKPTLSKRFDKWQTTGGLNLTESFVRSGSTAYFFPELKAQVELVENLLYGYGSWGQNIEKNAFLDLIDRNPYLNTDRNYHYTINHKLEGGLKASLSSQSSFNVTLGYSTVKNLVLFIIDPSAINKYTVIYDDAKVINLHGEFNHQYSEKIRLIAKADYNHYTLSQEQYAWHLPNYTGSIGATYNLGNKIYAKGDIMFYGTRKSKAVDNTAPHTLNRFVDVNLGVDYRYSKVFSLFLNLNNLFAQRYYIYENYPSQRFNLLAGLTYSF